MKLNPKFSDLLKKITTPSTAKLTHTTELPLLSEPDLKGFLQELYSENHPTARLIATLINGIMTHQMQTFMFSKRIMDGLLCNDPNVDTESCKSINYRDFMHKCLGDRFLVILRNHSGKKAGIYKLEDPLLLDILYKLHGKEYFKAQEEAVLHLYDNYDGNSSGNKLADLTIDEINKIGIENKKRVNDE